MTRLNVLIVDDDESIVKTLCMTVTSLGHRAAGASSAEQALHELARGEFDFLLTDLRMEGMSGVELVGEARCLRPSLVCVVMTAFAAFDNAVSAIRAGAWDYLPKPFDTEQLEHLLDKVSQIVGLRKENEELRAPSYFSGLSSPASLELRTLVERLSPSEATVLLSGETGAGKTALARTIHNLSPRADGPFVEVICSSLADTLFESEVFGHVRGAFTGAVKDKPGKFELAEGGTLFLDEIGELSASSQARLLQFLENRTVERVGSNQAKRLDVRVIAATNKELAALVQQGNFREDLYYRLNVFECRVPPLRERREDIPFLARRFLQEAARRNALVEEPCLPGEILAKLCLYEWPGNMRELRNAMERAAVLAAGREVAVGDFPAGLAAALEPASGREGSGTPRFPTLRDVEEAHIRRVLGMGVSMERAAEMLGINSVTLWRKRKEMMGRENGGN